MKIKLCNILHNIKIPIMSYGLIVFTIDKNKEVKYILINKKNTVGFCEIVKGTYDKKNIELSLRNVVKILTKQEVNILLNNTFDDIWKYMWNKNLDNNSKELFNKNKHIIHKLLKEKRDYWLEPEWEFPKGRKNYQERELDCAIREFSEETGINSNIINIVRNLHPIEEMYIGTNLNYYKHKYFLAYIDYSNIKLTNFQKQEVKNIELLNYSESLNKIRDYHISKKNCLKNVNYIISHLKFSL